MLEGAPTIFDMFLYYASQTEAIPRSLWLDDIQRATTEFMNRALPQAAYMDAGEQNAIATQTICAGLWAASGYPTLEITHRLAATLMATKIDADIEAQVVMPFPGVVVKMPDNLLLIEDPTGQPSSAAILAFAGYTRKNGDEQLSYLMMAQAASSMFAIHMPKVGFVSNTDFDSDKGEVSATEMDERSSEMARKLIMGLCLYLSDPNKLGQPKVGKKKKTERQRMPGQLPAVSTYVIGKEIQLDSNVITGVREYVKHGSKAPSVQYIVRGHWKMQAYGPGRSERKMIQIAPYWRGPVDAPILTHGGDASQIPAWIKRPPNK